MSAFENILKHIKARNSCLYFGDSNEIKLVKGTNPLFKAGSLKEEKYVFELIHTSGRSIIISQKPTYMSSSYCWSFDYKVSWDENAPGTHICNNNNTGVIIARKILENYGSENIALLDALTCAIEETFDYLLGYLNLRK